jgi:hypothetical protein
MELLDRQLTVFGKMHCNGKPIKSINVISWHPNWSLTWSWGITWNPNYIRNGNPFYYLRYGGYRSQGWYFMCGLKLPILGHISFSNQPTMDKKKFIKESA